MPSLATVLRREIRRAASREARKALKSFKRLQKQVSALRLTVRQRDRAIAGLERRVTRLRARAGRALRGALAVAKARGVGFSPQTVRSLRARLAMSRLRFARYLGVSSGSIFGWETGRTLPRGENLARLARARSTATGSTRGKTARAGRGRRKSRRRGRS